MLSVLVLFRWIQLTWRSLSESGLDVTFTLGLNSQPRALLFSVKSGQSA